MNAVLICRCILFRQTAYFHKRRYKAQDLNSSVKHSHEKEREKQKQTGLIKAVCASVHKRGVVQSLLVPAL